MEEMLAVQYVVVNPLRDIAVLGVNLVHSGMNRNVIF